MKLSLAFALPVTLTLRPSKERLPLASGAMVKAGFIRTGDSPVGAVKLQLIIGGLHFGAVCHSGRHCSRTGIAAVGYHGWRTKVEQLATGIAIGIKPGFMLLIHRVRKGQCQLVEVVTRFIQIF